MRAKITDLKVEKQYRKREVDAFGNVQRVPYTRMMPREVKVITGWRRFGHYMIDTVIIVLIQQLLIFGSVAADIPSEAIDLLFIANYAIYCFYYFLFESGTQRTLGKYVTQCLVINEYAEKPESGRLFVRSISRLIPFEAFSCLGDRGWHDKFSKTFVVSKNEYAELQKLLREHDGFILSDSEELVD